ncbi:hypothetical protein PBI_COUNT_2 [Microbacterium phage Count]|nr:hypothetical protein PBI_COUNT_2 [Microbacterium phage Count]
MADLTTTDEDAAAIKAILLQWKSEGNPNPLLPADVDIDGDGIVDSFGLDENDNVIVVSGTKLEDTVYVAEGEQSEDGGDSE